MTVCAFEENRLTVYKNLVAFELYFAEADIDGNSLVTALERSIKCVEVWCLSCPFFRIGDVENCFA